MRLTLSDKEVQLYSKMNRLCCKAIILENELNDALKWSECISLIELEQMQLDIDSTLEEIRAIKSELHSIQGGN